MSKAIQAIRANLLFTPFSFLISILSSLLVVRMLGPLIFAQYAISMALMSWIILTCEGGCNAGIGHYLKRAQQEGVLRSLYWSLHLRRWILIAIVVSILLTANSEKFSWDFVRVIGLSSDNIFLIGILGGLTLHSQLINALMLGAFMHKRQMLFGQLVVAMRGLALICLIQFTQNVDYLILALILVEIIHIAFNELYLRPYFNGQDLTAPRQITNQAQKHGLTGLYDKIITSLSGGQLILLVLAGVYSKIELAMLAVAMDSLQKLLSVAGTPISNLIAPFLNDSRQQKERFISQINLMSKCVLLWFSFVVGALFCTIPYLFLLLYGETYRSSIAIALVWVIPLFLESGIRGVWGTAMLISGRYSWILKSNTLLGIVFVSALVILRGYSLEAIVMSLGLLRALSSLWVYGHARKVGLYKRSGKSSFYVLISAVISTAISYVSIHLFNLPFLYWNFVLAFFIYTTFFIMLIRVLPVIDDDLRQIIFKIFGRYNWFAKLILGNGG